MQLWIKDSNPELTLSAFQVTCDQDARLHFPVTEFSADPRKNNDNKKKKNACSQVTFQEPGPGFRLVTQRIFSSA